MKVIFLDIDGVLNSAVYDRRRREDDGNIDTSRLPLLRRIAEESGAVIVLSSSWRQYWDPDIRRCGRIGGELVRTLAEEGITLFDKTPELGRRADEIRAWLGSHPETESFVILDDIFFGWGDLQSSLVRTSYYVGRGLEERHVTDAIKILMRGGEN